MTSIEVSTDPNVAREALLKTALECYLGTIQHISEFLVAVTPELASPHHEQLVKLRQRLAYQPTRESLLESQEVLDRELNAVAEKAGDSREGKVAELTRLSMFLAQVDDAFFLRKHGCADQLRLLAKEIDETADLGDPALARERLNAQLGQLRTFLEMVQQDSTRVFSRLQEQMEEYRTNLEAPGAASSCDPVTGLPNLREFARQIMSRLSTTIPFCLLIFNVGKPRMDEPVHPEFEDEILKQVGAGLVSQVRARDLVCRWEGGKFLVILECGLLEAAARARQISLWLSGHYRAPVNGRETIAELRASVGVTERHPDDDLHELVRRAESSLPAER
jgi:diguanylate cyclase (GGDEF)-like protein